MTSARAWRWWPLAAAPALWLLCGPAGDFPLNDEWTYAEPVRRLLAEGTFRLCEHASAPGAPQVLAGAFACRVLGFSYTVLRMTGLLWALLGAAFLDAILRELDVEPRRRALAVLVFLGNPLSLYLALTFHTDMPFIALGLGTLHFLIRARRTRGRDEIWAGLLAGLAAATRQTGVLLVVGGLLDRFRRGGAAGAGRFLLGLSPAVLFYLWLYLGHGATWAMTGLVQGETLQAFSSFRLLADFLSRLWAMVLYGALFSLPLLRPPSGKKGWLLFSAAAAAALFLAPWPRLINVLHPQGLGPLTGAGTAWKSGGAWASPWVWDFVLPWLSGISLLGAAALMVKGSPAESKDFFRLSFPPLHALLSRLVFFDRYMLPAWAWTLPAVAAGDRSRPPSAAAWLLGVLVLALSVLGLRDHFAWNRAKWALGEKAVALGCRPEEVANGRDWTAHWAYETRMARLLETTPRAAIGEADWQRGPLPKMFVTFDPALYPLRNLAGVRRYASPLGGGALYLFRSEGDAPSR